MGKKKEKQSSSGVSEDAKPPPSKKAKVVEDSDTETQETSSHKKGMLSYVSLKWESVNQTTTIS